MPLGDVIILAVIIAGFAVFALFLAWGEHQTRNLARNDGQKPQSSETPRVRLMSEIQASRQLVQGIAVSGAGIHPHGTIPAQSNKHSAA